MESFGKTGTASDERDLWFVGGTPTMSLYLVWGYDAPYDMTKTLSKSQAKTRTCVAAWKAFMEAGAADLPHESLPQVGWRSGAQLLIPQSGLLASGSCPSTAVGFYRADDLPDVQLCA